MIGYRRRLAALVWAAVLVLGAGLVYADLSIAISRSHKVFAVDLAGARDLGTIALEAREDRRLLLLALAAPSFDDLSAHVKAAKETDASVGRASERLRRLVQNRPEAARAMEAWMQAWQNSKDWRDEIVQHLYSGDGNGAMQIDVKRGQASFGIAMLRFAELAQVLEGESEERSKALNAILARFAVELALLSAAGLGFLFALIRAYRQRDEAARELRGRNRELGAARLRERRRAAILEKIGTQASLADIFHGVAELVDERGERCGIAVWVLSDAELRFHTGVHLPVELQESLEKAILPPAGGLTEADAELPFQDREGRTIGLLRIYPGPGKAPLEATIAKRAGRLCALAVENRLLYDRLAFQAQHDVLTGLPNRMLFHDRLQQALHRARREGTQVGVLWLDLDHYKAINDTLGHSTGDEVLRYVAQRLLGSVRRSDTAGRVGGDEFTILLCDAGQPADIERIAHKILEQLAAPMQVAGRELVVTTSCGISLFPEDGDDPALLLHKADAAMYQAKRAGRNRSRFFEAEMDQPTSTSDLTSTDCSSGCCSNGTENSLSIFSR